MGHSDLELLLLKHVQSSNYRPVKPRVIMRQLGLPDARRAEVRKAIKRLAKQGLLGYGSNHLVQAADASSRPNEIIGTFQRTAGGFGFVRPRGTKPSQERLHDIYIP